MTTKKANFLLLFTAAIGGLGIIGNQVLLDGTFHPFQIIAGRFFLASLFITLFFLNKLSGITKEEIVSGAVIGFFLFGCFAFMVIGLRYTTPSVNGFLINTHSMLIPIFSLLFFRKKPDFTAVLGGGLTVAGIAVLSIDDQFHLNTGALITLIGTASSALQLLFTEHKASKYNTVHVAVIQNITVFLLAFLCSFFTGVKWPSFTPQIGLTFLVISFFSTFLFYILLLYGQKYTSSASAGILISSESIFTAIYSFLFYHEKIGIQLFVGAFLIFTAIVLVETKPAFLRKEKSTSNQNSASSIEEE